MSAPVLLEKNDSFDGDLLTISITSLTIIVNKNKKKMPCSWLKMQNYRSIH